MNTLKTFIFLLELVMAIAIASTLGESLPFNAKNDIGNQEIQSSLYGRSRFFSHKYDRYRTGQMTCDRYPKVCRAKGSPGRNCCFKKCVDMETDRFNCGRCGKRCRYSEVCCKGKCVNPMFDKKHCGRCYNKCKRGSSCSYGMCSYA